MCLVCTMCMVCMMCMISPPPPLVFTKNDIISGFRDGWRNGRSVFEWADKGAWRCSTSEELDFDGRKFRIGFEPLFVDFTKEGAVYIIFLLFKWFAFGVVAGACRARSPRVSYLCFYVFLCSVSCPFLPSLWSFIILFFVIVICHPPFFLFLSSLYLIAASQPAILLYSYSSVLLCCNSGPTPPPSHRNPSSL